MRGEKATVRSWQLLPLLIAAGLLGCAGLLAQPASYGYFGTPAVDDPWSSKITAWQIRDRRAGGGARAPVSTAAEAPPSRGEGLRSKYLGFQADRKRRTAREFMTWIQAQADEHYIPDGPIDHWATLEETLRGDGDDCDGLELLVFHALRDQGFGTDEVFRAVVHRPSDGQHHMVTLWFEHANDPWVIDPTGAMTRRMVRMSELPDWAPLKVFSDTEEYTAHPILRAESAATLASNP